MIWCKREWMLLAAAVAALAFCTASASAEYISKVYESFDYTDTGGGNELNGKTADSGLGAWSSSYADILTPGFTYSDRDTPSNTLPVAGNMVNFQRQNGANATADILASGWSSSNIDGSRLNAKGATIWWSTILRQDIGDPAWNDSYYCLKSNNGGYLGFLTTYRVSDGKKWSWKMVATNDTSPYSGLSVSNIKAAPFTTFGVKGPKEVFLVAKLETDWSGNTTFSTWVNPLLDDESALGAPHGTMTISANSNGSVTHFDKITMHTGGNGATAMKIDEIRMDESFNGVVGAAPIPEPGTLALLGMAVVGLAWHAWRKRKR